MAKRARRIAAVALVLPVAALALAGCGESAGSDPLAISDWLDGHGVPCRTNGVYDSVTVSAVPFTRVTCDGVQVDYFEAGAADRYDAFWAADCAATPADDRAGLEQAIVVRGPTWVMRGTGAEEPGSWPQALVGASGVTPAAAADALGGRSGSVAEVCRDLGAWTA